MDITRKRICWTGFVWDWRSQTVKCEVEEEQEEQEQEQEQEEEEEEEEEEEKAGEEESTVVMMIIMIMITVLFPVSLINLKQVRTAANSTVHFHIEKIARNWKWKVGTDKIKRKGWEYVKEKKHIT